MSKVYICFVDSWGYRVVLSVHATLAGANGAARAEAERLTGFDSYVRQEAVDGDGMLWFTGSYPRPEVAAFEVQP